MAKTGPRTHEASRGGPIGRFLVWIGEMSSRKHNVYPKTDIGPRKTKEYFAEFAQIVGCTSSAPEDLSRFLRGFAQDYRDARAACELATGCTPDHGLLGLAIDGLALELEAATADTPRLPRSETRRILAAQTDSDPAVWECPAAAGRPVKVDITRNPPTAAKVILSALPPDAGRVTLDPEAARRLDSLLRAAWSLWARECGERGDVRGAL